MAKQSALDMLEKMEQEEAERKAAVEKRRAEILEKARGEVSDAVNAILAELDVYLTGNKAALADIAKPVIEKWIRTAGFSGGKTRAPRGSGKATATAEDVATVRAALSAEGETLGTLSKKVGLDSAVVSAALKSLIAEGKASKEGEKRGTKYSKA